MTCRFRISERSDVGVLLDSAEAASFACDHCPGRCDVDEQSLDPFPGSHVSAIAWASVIHHDDPKSSRPGPSARIVIGGVAQPVPCQRRSFNLAIWTSPAAGSPP